MINISYDIKEYRKQLFDIANDGNIIVELGCHVGNTTKLILDKFDNVSIIAIDNSPEAIDKMEKLADEYSNLTFISGDVRRHEILLKAFRLTQSCDVLSVDLGGGYHPDTVFKVFYIWSSTFKPTHSSPFTLLNSQVICASPVSKFIQDSPSSALIIPVFIRLALSVPVVIKSATIAPS